MTQHDFGIWRNRFENAIDLLKAHNPKGANDLKQNTFINTAKRTIKYTGNNVKLARYYLPPSSFTRPQLH